MGCPDLVATGLIGSGVSEVTVAPQRQSACPTNASLFLKLSMRSGFEGFARFDVTPTMPLIWRHLCVLVPLL